MATTTAGDEQALVFTLDDQPYCVSIDDVDEIVDRSNEITALPDLPPHVEGVVDRRGITTTVIDPKPVLGKPAGATGRRMIVFDADTDTDENPVGWVVDEVRQVISVADGDLDTSVESDLSRGVVRADGDFVVWLRPDEIR